MRTTLLLTLTLAAPGFLGAEDHFTFNDGRTIDGTYLGGTDQEVKILYGSTELIVPRNSVQRIDLAVKGETRSQAPVVQPVVIQPVAAPATYTPPPQVVYVQQPAPVYVAPSPSVVWSVGFGSGWYGSRWDHHHRPCYIAPLRGCGPTWSVGFQSHHGWR